MISNYVAWNEYLKDEFKKDYFVKMKNFLNEEYKIKQYFLLMNVFLLFLIKYHQKTLR